MTARDGVRRARADADRAYATEAGPSLPERLVAARERKGVDLYRAERDTKIRARYLAALEHGEYSELPGAVYTKGFLRNYALYLGLDPEDVIRQWRRERGDATVPAEPVLAVPKPLAAPRQGLTFSPVIVVAALLTSCYRRVRRLHRRPARAVREAADPRGHDPGAGRDRRGRGRRRTFVLRGTSIPGATVTIKDAGARPAVPGHRRRRGASGPPRSTSAAGATSSTSARSTRRPASRPRTPPTRPHHRAVPRDRDADAQLRLSPPRAHVRERGDPGQGTTSNAAERLGHGRPTDGTGADAPRRARRVGGPPGAPGRRASVRPPSRWARTARSTRRSTCRPASGRSPSPRPPRRARRSPDPERRHRLQGRQPGRRDQGAARGSRSGSTARSARSRGPPGRVQPGQGAHVHRQGIDRGPDREVERDVLHAQRREPGPDVQQWATRRPGCSPRPTRRSGPTGPDDGGPARRARRAAPGPMRRRGA